MISGGGGMCLFLEIFFYLLVSKLFDDFFDGCV